MILTKQVKSKIQVWVDKFPHKQAALIMALRIVQEEKGYLADEMINDVADYLEVPRILAYEVVSFYSLYRREKGGRCYLKVCRGLSCVLAGCEDMVTYLEKAWKTKLGKKNPKGVMLEETDCLGACNHAPVALLNEKEYLERLDIEKVDQLIERLKEELA